MRRFAYRVLLAAGAFALATRVLGASIDGGLSFPDSQPVPVASVPR
jgi:hypothetical protein